MAELDFEIKGKHGDIAASTFERAVAQAVAILREFDSAISGKPRGSLRWYIERLQSNGSLVVGFQSRLKRFKKRQEQPIDISPAVADSFLTGFDDLENKCQTPAYLSEFGLRKADDLASLIGKNGATGFRFVSAKRSIEVTGKTAENIEKLLPIKRRAIGSVEGKLEAINLHGQSRFLVYHAISKKAVTCVFEEGRYLDTIKDYLGKRVIVSGTLHKNVNGDTLRIEMERISLAEDSRKVQLDPDWSDPEFADAPSTAEYMRRIRGGG